MVPVYVDGKIHHYAAATPEQEREIRQAVKGAK
jgi:hypothetical protein